MTLTLTCEVEPLTTPILICRIGEDSLKRGNHSRVKLSFYSSREPNPGNTGGHGITVRAL